MKTTISGTGSSCATSVESVSWSSQRYYRCSSSKIIDDFYSYSFEAAMSACFASDSCRSVYWYSSYNTYYLCRDNGYYYGSSSRYVYTPSSHSYGSFGRESGKSLGVEGRVAGWLCLFYCLFFLFSFSWRCLLTFEAIVVCLWC